MWLHTIRTCRATCVAIAACSGVAAWHLARDPAPLVSRQRHPTSLQYERACSSQASGTVGRLATALCHSHPETGRAWSVTVCATVEGGGSRRVAGVAGNADPTRAPATPPGTVPRGQYEGAPAVLQACAGVCTHVSKDLGTDPATDRT